MKNKVWSAALDVLKTAIGCALFALGFDLFLVPGGMNAGGLSGLAMIFVHLTNIASVGVITALLNVPLFILAGVKICLIHTFHEHSYPTHCFSLNS